VKVLIIIILFLTACNPQKKLARLLNKNPSLVSSSDTTIYFETKSVDTSFIFSSNSNRDTFVIFDTKTKIYRHYDTIRLEQLSIRDSIFVNTHTIKSVSATEKELKKNLIISLSLIAFMFLMYALRNLIK